MRCDRLAAFREQLAIDATGVCAAFGMRRPVSYTHLYAGHADDLAQGDIHVYIFQIVHPRAADLDMIDHLPVLSPTL